MNISLHKKIFGAIILLVAFVPMVLAQNPGDTIKVRTFQYGSNTRDTVAQFPAGNLTFEKIIMRYSMRCKNGLVSNSTNRNQGCGEWDYSCNTFIVDSSRAEEFPATQPNYVVSNFSGTSFPYTTQAPYDYYRFAQQQVSVNTIVSETTYVVNSGSESITNLMKTDEHSGRSFILYTAAELTAAGVPAGELDAIVLPVTNVGGWAHFMKVKLKHTMADSLDARYPDLSGYTEVYNCDYHFVNGNNRIPFKSAFVWDGVSNIIVELSYTNTVPSTPIVFEGLSHPSRNMALNANNNGALDLVNLGQAKLDVSNMASASNEITISFWAYGNAAMMPTNTTILYGYAANANDRHLNIHLPYGNNNIYFDCGFAAGGYDRVFKAAVASEQGGKWNHWTFTKNAQTGNMKIFLNGVLWTSATGMVKPISLLNLILGSGLNNATSYKGKISELAIWNKEMPDGMVAQWMQQPANTNHPLYANLLSYYPMNEGAGQVITNAVTAMGVTGKNLQWTNERGHQLTRGFTESPSRPTIQFITGTYVQTNTPITVTDSVPRNPVTVNQYSIVSKAGATPITSDVVKLDTTYTGYYAATRSKIYDGDSGLLIDSVAVVAEGQLQITALPYYQRYPFYNEIMSFVTPYGLGLDLGMEGKSWYFDVSDFAPLLQNNKRIVMTMGGQNQEQNDIEFWFIVGTPPRNVLEFKQIWQGSNRTGNAPIADIISEARYSAVGMPLLNAGKTFKIRSSITGHGSRGEFESNGGPIDHMLNIQGGATEFVWSVSRPCSMNPVFPQGGTWIYARQGWCPGMATSLVEHDITSMVSPGTTATIDYNISNPQASGEYTYLVTHQLVTYGDANFQTDARILDVIQPSTKIEFGRTNPGCSAPQIIIQNTGSNTATSMVIKYWINTNTALTYTWSGSLKFMESQTINLPVKNLWSGGTLASGNMFYAEITKVNNQADQNLLNNKMASPFARPEVVPQSFTLEFRTNNNPTENKFKLVDVYGNIVDQKTFTTANTTYTSTYNLVGCYKLIVEDAGEDGVSFWANSNQGTGFVRLKRSSGTILKTFQPDFGAGFEYAFTTNWTLATEETDARQFGQDLTMYPNPSAGFFTLDGKDVEGAMVTITDITGRIIGKPLFVPTSFVEMNQQTLTTGMYFVVIEKNGQRVVKELMIR